jgi:N-acyl amino acid synthase of PEP-CTERM/exosortase system
MEKTKTTLLEDFQEYFELDLATDSALMEKVFRIRYRVYCEEFGYEPAEAFPSEQECDQFDDYSIHCLITHKSSQTPAGCLRLVKAGDQALMPMEKYCAPCVDHQFIDALGVSRDTMCEFSRLAVDGAFRRRAGEHVSRFGEFTAMDCSQRERRTFSLIAVSTFIAGFAVSELLGRTNCFAMMEPFLPRLLQRSGIFVRPAGTEIDYHGIRAPYFITTADAVNGMPDELRALYDLILEKFSTQFPAAAAGASARAAVNGGMVLPRFSVA